MSPMDSKEQKKTIAHNTTINYINTIHARICSQLPTTRIFQYKKLSPINKLIL